MEIVIEYRIKLQEQVQVASAHIIAEQIKDTIYDEYEHVIEDVFYIVEGTIEVKE